MMRLVSTLLLLSLGLAAGEDLNNNDIIVNNSIDDTNNNNENSENRELQEVSSACQMAWDRAVHWETMKADTATWKLTKQMVVTLCGTSGMRKLQEELSLTGVHSLAFVTSLLSPPIAQFEKPCYAIPDDFAAEGWSMLEAADDQGISANLPFDFNLYGTTYPAGTKFYVNNNGHINFGERQYAQYTAGGFPIADFPIIAAFWSDVDTSESEFDATNAYGAVWYKAFPAENKFAVIWNKVGYYEKHNDLVNTFQLIISDGNNDEMGQGQNACFCYLDMQWTTGDASGGSGGFGGRSADVGSATVGVNAGNGVDFAQFGRFNRTGTSYDGSFGDADGVDYLDYRGAINSLGAMCMNVQAPNVPPIAVGFPSGDSFTISCAQNIDLTLVFSTPELDQEITVTLPMESAWPEGLTMTGNENDQASVSIDLKWTPTQAQAGETYTFQFLAVDDHSPPGVLMKTLTIVVEGCEEPDSCVPLDVAPTCTVGPVCTPWRSPEHCLADESLPLLIKGRTDAVKTTPQPIFDAGYWFPYLDDRAAAYAYTISQGFPAPQLFCCVSTVEQIGIMCPLPSSFVIRATNSHSNEGIFVFPNGFGNLEHLSQMNMTLQDVANKINEMPTPPEKILVESFVNAGTPEAPALPTEYKFHVFNGEIGAVTVIMNRGTDCECYAEVDMDLNRLDKNGCFVPSVPMGENLDGDMCYDVDKDAGSKNPYTIKGMDFCGKLDDPPTCVWEDMKTIAITLGMKIGVYMRIDMFVDASNNVYVQEYTANHNGGLRHCTSKDENGCLNSCFMGQLWKSKSPGDALKYGGPVTSQPSIFNNWGTYTPLFQCAAAGAAISTGPEYVSRCANP